MPQSAWSPKRERALSGVLAQAPARLVRAHEPTRLKGECAASRDSRRTCAISVTL
jgi:hypothetical protein